MIEFITCGRADENGEPRIWKIGIRGLTSLNLSIRKWREIK
jgi:hypothetical protein